MCLFFKSLGINTHWESAWKPNAARRKRAGNISVVGISGGKRHYETGLVTWRLYGHAHSIKYDTFIVLPTQKNSYHTDVLLLRAEQGYGMEESCLRRLKHTLLMSIIAIAAVEHLPQRS